MHGRMQKVPVTTEPQGAFVRASNGQECTTPGVLRLDRSAPYHNLHIEKDGYEPIDITLKRTMDGWVFGNFLTTGLIGIIFDFATGCAYMITPSEASATLERKGVDTSRLDTENNIYIFIGMKESYPGLDPSKRVRIN